MNKRIRIGFVGAGGMGQCAHLRNYVTIPDCEVVAIAELYPKLREAVVRKYGVPLYNANVYKDTRGETVVRKYVVPHAYASGEEMLAKEKLDGIVASQMFTRHGTLVPELLKAGIPVFTEKPLAGSIQMGEKIVKAVAASGTWLMVGYHKRSDPAVMYAKDTITRLKASGEIGKLKYVRLTMPFGDWVAGGLDELLIMDKKKPTSGWDPLPPDMDKESYERWFVLVNNYIHQINLMQHLVGEEYHVTYADRPGVLLVGESAGGVTCTIEMNPYVTTVDWNEEAFVAFERGYIKITLPAPLAVNRPGRVEVFMDQGNGVMPQTTVPQLPWIHAMRQQAINFVRAIKGEIKPMCEAAEALEDLKLARDYLKLWKGT